MDTSKTLALQPSSLSVILAPEPALDGLEAELGRLDLGLHRAVSNQVPRLWGSRQRVNLSSLQTQGHGRVITALSSACSPTRGSYPPDLSRQAEATSNCAMGHKA